MVVVISKRGACRAAIALPSIVVLQLALGACSPGRRAGGEPSPVRNLILVSIDTMRGDRLGAQRGSVHLTPRLDAFAARAARFTDCRSASGTTLASHKAMFSGRYPTYFLADFSRARREGATPFPPVVYYRHALSRWPVPSVASLLREAGFATAGFVDDGYLHPRFGLGEGFETWASERIGIVGHRPRAQRWLESQGSHRFFLLVHTYDVHCPYDPPAPHLRLFEEGCTGRLDVTQPCGNTEFAALDLTAEDFEHVARHYDAEVRHVDEELGRFLDWLDSTGRLDDTAVVVTSDHGESLGERSVVGHGGLHDNQLHVPLVVYVPGRSPAVIDAPVSGVDVGPTILDLLLGRVPDGLDGASLEGLLSGSPTDAAAFARRPRMASATVVEGRSGATRLRKLAVMDPAGLKLIADLSGPSAELYDLLRDPKEAHDLFGTGHPREKDLVELAGNAAVGPLRGLAAESEGPDQGLSPEDVEALRSLGYVDP